MATRSTQSPDLPDNGQDFIIRETLAILSRRKLIFLVTLVVCIAAGAAFTFTRKPIFEGSAQLVVSQKQSSGAASDPTDILTSLQSAVGNRSTETQVEIVNGEGLMRAVAASLTTDDWSRGLRMKPSISLPKWTHAAEAKTDTELITITTHAYDPIVAAKIANTIARLYLARDSEHNKEATQKAADYVDRSRARIEGEMKVAALRLAEYQTRTQLLDTDIQTAEMAKGLVLSQTAVDSVRADVEAGKRQVKNLEAQIQATGHEIKSRYTLEQTPEFLRAQQRFSDIAAKLRADQTEYAVGAPEIKSDELDLEAEKKNLKSVTQKAVSMEERSVNPVYAQLLGEYTVAKALEAGNENRLASAQSDLSLHYKEFHAIPIKAQGLAGAKMRFEELKSTFDLLTTKYYALLIQEEQSLPNGQLETPAIKPETPSSPNKPLFLSLTVVISVMLAAIASIIAERLDTRIHDPETVDRMTGLVPLAMIPTVSPLSSDTKYLLIGSVDPDHAFLESYRLLRHNIGFAAPDRNLKVISLTSSSASEGKTTCVFNLAVVLAMDNKRVLIIDADLRRPSIHKWANISRDVGLTSVVKGSSKLDEAIQATRIDGVSCLASGPLPPNPTEFLNSEHFKQVVKDASELFDIVLIDSPPCAGMSDAVVISTLVDAMLLVVVLDRTEKHFLGATVRMLHQANAPLLGTIFNRMPQNQRSAYYYYYYYNYYYAYGGVDYGSDDSDSAQGRVKSARRRAGKGNK